jgi:hypothetical protein
MKTEKEEHEKLSFIPFSKSTFCKLFGPKEFNDQLINS